MLESNIFSIYIKHSPGAPASYRYLLLPGSTQEKTATFDTSRIQILRNDEEAQVAFTGGMYYIAAWQTATIRLSGNKEICIKHREPICIVQTESRCPKLFPEKGIQ